MIDIGLEDVISNLSPMGQMEWENAVLRTQIQKLEAAQCTCDCEKCCGTEPGKE